jgi:hypothetical protein
MDRWLFHFRHYRLAVFTCIPVGMTRDYRNTAIAALAALLLTLMVLMFVARNPWMLVGVAAVLWAIAAIVRAINGTPDPDHAARHRGHRNKDDNTHDHQDHQDHDPQDEDGAVNQPDSGCR